MAPRSETLSLSKRSDLVIATMTAGHGIRINVRNEFLRYNSLVLKNIVMSEKQYLFFEEKEYDKPEINVKLRINRNENFNSTDVPRVSAVTLQN